MAETEDNMKFFDWLEENYGIDRHEWDENYSYSDGQGKEIWGDYEYCMEKLEENARRSRGQKGKDMKPEFKEGQRGMTRGYFIYATRYAGCISKECAEDPNNIDVGIAYTFWHRHDEDPAIVEAELEKIAKCYVGMFGYAGGMYGYEYTPYRR